MRKQYWSQELLYGKYELRIYHDGKLIESKQLWLDEFIDETDRLEDDGYTPGCTQSEVDAAKARYENCLRNLIHEIRV